LIQVIRARRRYFSDLGWLQTFWLFSFSDYYDPENVQFGTLRVFNDDLVDAEGGFPTHTDRDMEIVTIVLAGEITFRDGTGATAVLKPGDVQILSAGKGLTHSEFNLGEAPAHLYQIWIFPNRIGLEPGCDRQRFPASAWNNRLLPVASGRGVAETVMLHADATLYRASLDTGREIPFSTGPGRKIFMYVSSGTLAVNTEKLEAGDQARIEGEAGLLIKAQEGAEFVLIDLPSGGGGCA
jgi:redox-sensitive bicupin YhaK (pirin superfamily)